MLHTHGNWHSIRQHESVNRVVQKWYALVALFLLMFGIFALFFAGNMAAHNDTAEKRERFNAYFSSENDIEIRKQRAQSIIDNLDYLKKMEEKEIGVYAAVDEPVYFSQIQSVAKTGTYTPLSTDRMGWNDLGRLWARQWFIVTWMMIGSGLLFTAYVTRCSADWRYVADLPWKKPGSWIWLALTSFPPIGLGTYAVSYITVLRKRRRELPLTNEVAETDSEWTDTAPAQLMIHDPAALQRAREVLVDYLSNRTSRTHFIQLDEARYKRDEAEAQLSSLRQQMRETQADWQAACVTVSQLEQIVPEVAELNISRFNESFDALMRLHGVMDVYTRNGELCVLVRVFYEYLGDVYDLGDIELRFNPSRPLGIQTRELRNARRLNCRFVRSLEQFCFGDGGVLIKDNLSESQIVQAFASAVHMVHMVNPEDRPSITTSYKKIKPLS